MNEIGIGVVAIVGATTLVVAIITLLKVRHNSAGEQSLTVIRGEIDRLRQIWDEQGRSSRQELAENLRGFSDSNLKSFLELRDSLAGQVREFGSQLDTGIKAVDDRSRLIGEKLDTDIARMGQEAQAGRDTLRSTIDGRLEASAVQQMEHSKSLREEVSKSFGILNNQLIETLNQLSMSQKERLEVVGAGLNSLTERFEKAQEALKAAVEKRLDDMRQENARKLEEMRVTVDEKLQATLDTRLGESFNRVVEQLERVHKGIGEVQSLASNVGDLKRVLSNIKVRGTLGEVQLGQLLEQFLSPEQFVRNARVNDETNEVVEFAIKLPGRDQERSLLLPIDAKFPQEDYERLVIASEAGNAEQVAEAVRNLETRVRSFAKSIQEKYICPPNTTEFAILFLPTEGLYAEVLRRPGLFEQLQRNHRVTLAGPTTLTAILNALQMGFRSMALEKRSSEVWEILGAVRGEFGKYNQVVDKLSRQLGHAARSVEKLGTRTRAMTRKLRAVETLPDEKAAIVLGVEALTESEIDVEELGEEAVREDTTVEAAQ